MISGLETIFHHRSIFSNIFQANACLVLGETGNFIRMKHRSWYGGLAHGEISVESDDEP